MCIRDSHGGADVGRDMAFDLDHALRYLIAAEGSDLHLKVPSYPLIRLHGNLEPIVGTERLFPEDTRQALAEMLPDAVTTLANQERGIILLTGTTGSGKSTTLAAMIDHMNRTMQKHIVTIEDPIEFLHRDRTSIINQREVGQDTASFKRALRRVLE